MSPQTYTLSTRMPDRWSGGPVRPQVEDFNQQLRNSNCRHLLILVHGFNNSAAAVKASYDLLLANLEELFRRSRSAPDAVALFHWPGDVAGLGSAAAYPYDIPQACQSAQRLADYLRAFPRASTAGAMKISLIGHSLGCRLILEMLANQLSTALALNIDVISLMAPAVAVPMVEGAANLAVSVRSPRRILKCYSRQDWVLWGAFPAGQMTAFRFGQETGPYREFVGSGLPQAIGLYGNPTAMGIPVETTNGHGDYWGDIDVANQYSAEIDPTFRTLPPPRREPTRRLPQATDLGFRELPTRD